MLLKTRKKASLLAYSHALKDVCKILLRKSDMLKVGTVEEYLAKGPGFMFLFHPALGPLWDVVAQKIRGGALAPGAELVLEVGSHLA